MSRLKDYLENTKSDIIDATYGADDIADQLIEAMEDAGLVKTENVDFHIATFAHAEFTFGKFKVIVKHTKG